MGFIRRPSYYKDFQCIAGACTDSCCDGWEIDIDDDTWQYYKNAPGVFGERLRKNIAPPDPDNGFPAHFIGTADDRCPFLNACGLCDIFSELGEEHLSQICTHHPRYYDWLLAGEEGGLGLCCEAACELILSQKGSPLFDETKEDEEDESSEEDEELDIERALEDILFSSRTALFDLISSDRHPDCTFAECCDAVYRCIPSIQSRCDEILFPAYDEDDSESENAFSDSWTELFFREDAIDRLLAEYQSYEINDPAWWALLTSLRSSLPDILSKRNEYLKSSEYHDEELRQLLIYFLYRHFMKAREEGNPEGVIRFSLMSACTLELLMLARFTKQGPMTLKDRIDLCKLFSKEIEYDEGITRSLFDFTFE